MTDAEKLLRAVLDMREQVFVLRRVQQKMMQQHRRRIELLDKLIADQKGIQTKLGRLLKAVMESDEADDWWKKGDAAP